MVRITGKDIARIAVHPYFGAVYDDIRTYVAVHLGWDISLNQTSLPQMAVVETMCDLMDIIDKFRDVAVSMQKFSKYADSAETNMKTSYIDMRTVLVQIMREEDDAANKGATNIAPEPPEPPKEVFHLQAVERELSSVLCGEIMLAFLHRDKPSGEIPVRYLRSVMSVINQLGVSPKNTIRVLAEDLHHELIVNMDIMAARAIIHISEFLKNPR